MRPVLSVLSLGCYGLLTCDNDTVIISWVDMIQFDRHQLDHHCSNGIKPQVSERYLQVTLSNKH